MLFPIPKIQINVLEQSKVRSFFKKFKPEYVFLGSLRSGGIAANQKFPAEFIYENIQSQNLVIEAAHRWKVKKLYIFPAPVFILKKPNSRSRKRHY